MSRCPITYQETGNLPYSVQGLKLLSPALKKLDLLNYSAKELREEAMFRASKMSIQGVQPKLSAILNIQKGRFEIVDKNGKFIMKPQHHLFPELPENEDLTMRLAETIGIEVPLHGLIWSKDHSLTYFIKRFDRKGFKNKLAVEDFAQLAGMSRDTKYNYSMEKLVKLVEDYCTFPMVEKARLFRLVLFNFLVGNEDMHLKNYSVMTENNLVALSPAYDLLNTSIVLKGDIEEIALPLYGKKKKLTPVLLLDYFGRERCGLTERIIEQTVETIKNAHPSWPGRIENSFLSSEMKEKYLSLVQSRIKIMNW
jgi:serine/threonine-protein kinase HipA